MRDEEKKLVRDWRAWYEWQRKTYGLVYRLWVSIFAAFTITFGIYTFVQALNALTR